MRTEEDRPVLLSFDLSFLLKNTSASGRAVRVFNPHDTGQSGGQRSERLEVSGYRDENLTALIMRRESDGYGSQNDN